MGWTFPWTQTFLTKSISREGGLSRSPGILKGAVCCRTLIGRTHLHWTAAVKLQTCLFHFYMSLTLFESGLVGKWSKRREATRCGQTTRCGLLSSGCRRNPPLTGKSPRPPVRGLTEVCRQNGYCFISCAYSNVFLAGKFYITFPERGKKDN